MFKLSAAAVLGLLAMPASAQVAVTLTQQSDATREAVPIFRVTVVGRTTAAISYRPRSGETKVDLIGTTLAARQL
jgi:hypothetical protein